MRKVSTFLSASLGLAWVTAAGAQQAPDMFKDLDPNHWAYQATENLRMKGILIGYPDQYFRGKRTLTRYEFATALDRLLKNLPAGTPGPPGQPGANGQNGERGPQGEAGPAGMTPEEVMSLRKLTNEFHDELAALGNNMAAVNRRIDGIAKDVADVKAALAKLPKWSFRSFMAFRSDSSSGDMVDRNGRLNALVGGGAGQEFVHAFDAGLESTLPGGATFKANLTTGTLLGYEGGANGIAQEKASVQNAASETFLTRAALSAPFGAVGRNSVLTIGRQGLKLGHLTLYRPDTDVYFDIPWLDNGEYTVDGARLTTNFGSVSVDAFGGLTRTVQASTSGSYNNPIAGAAGSLIFGMNPFGLPGAGTNSKPTGQIDHGGIDVEQLAGISLGLPIHQLQGGRIGFTAFDTAETGFVKNEGVTILGSNADLKLSDKLTATADWAKTITHAGRFDKTLTLPDGRSSGHDNNAFNANVGYGKDGDPFRLRAGYKYIDPLYYAPGYWGRIGNWLNPTNIQGPNFRADLKPGGAIGVNVGGDFLTAARSRAAAGSLGSDDDIKRILVGLRWDIAKNFQGTIDWEGVYWHLEGAHTGLGLATGDKVNPTEHYLRIGTGYNLTSGTVLKMMWESGAFNGHGALTNGAGANTNSYNAFVTSAAIHF